MAAEGNSNMWFITLMSAMFWAFVFCISSCWFLAACTVLAICWGLAVSFSIVCWVAAWAIRACFRAIIRALNSSSSSPTNTSTPKMLLQPLYKAIPISSLNLLAAPMPAPVLAPGAGADTLTVQAASPTCSPAKSMQAHGHPQQQETPPAASYTPARSPNPDTMPELAMPASFPISLRMSPEPSSVEVQQDNNAIAADADNSDASQEQLTEAEDDSLEQQEEEQEQDDEAMPGGDDDTILDLDDAPHGETILQEFSSEKQLIAEMREWLDCYALREQQGFTILNQGHGQLVATQAALIAANVELLCKDAKLATLWQLFNFIGFVLTVQAHQRLQTAQNLQHQLDNQADQLRDARAAQQVAEDAQRAAEAAKEAAEVRAMMTGVELTCVKDRLAEVERRSSSSGSSSASSFGMSQQSSSRNISDDMSWLFASGGSRPWQQQQAPAAAGAVGAASDSSGACAVSASVEMS